MSKIDDTVTYKVYTFILNNGKNIIGELIRTEFLKQNQSISNNGLKYFLRNPAIYQFSYSTGPMMSALCDFTDNNTIVLDSSKILTELGEANSYAVYCYTKFLEHHDNYVKQLEQEYIDQMAQEGSTDQPKLKDPITYYHSIH